MRKPWFRPKIFGLGWMPISWEGWLMTLAYVMLIIYSVSHILARTGSAGSKTAAILILVLPVTLLFSLIAYIRSTARNSTNKEQ